MTQFKKGDHVRLATGDRIMKLAYDFAGGRWRCLWLGDDGKVRGAVFDERQLERVPDDELTPGDDR